MIWWSLALFITHQKITNWNYIFNIGIAFFYLSGATIAFLFSKRNEVHNSVTHELLSIGAGVMLFGIGLLIWSYYNLVLHVDIPYPSFADVVYVFYIPILAYGVVSLLRVYGIMISKAMYIQTFVIFVLAAIFIFAVGNPPDLSNSIPLLAKVFTLYYLLGDALLITLGIMLIRLTKGRIHNSFFYFFLAFFSMTTADFLFSYRTAHEIYWNGDVSDVFYALAGLLFTLGIIKIVATQSIITKYFSQPAGKNPPKIS